MYNHFNSLHHSNDIVTIPIKCVKKSELLASFLILKDALSESQNITFVFFKWRNIYNNIWRNYVIFIIFILIIIESEKVQVLANWFGCTIMPDNWSNFAAKVILHNLLASQSGEKVAFVWFSPLFVLKLGVKYLVWDGNVHR